MFFPFGVRLKDGRDSNIDRGRLESGAIKPGDFLSIANDPPQGIRLVPDEDAPYEWLAVDREYGSGTDWAWMGPLFVRRIGKPRLDRIADLARWVRFQVNWMSENLSDPRSGRLSPGQLPPHSAPMIEYSDGSTWCVLVLERDLSDDPKYPFPLSVFGQLKILGLLLQEKCFELCKDSPQRAELIAVAKIAAAVGQPVEWSSDLLNDLDAIPGELIRCAHGHDAQGELLDRMEELKAIAGRSNSGFGASGTSAVDAIDENDASILAFLNRTPNLRRKVSDVLPDKGPQDRKAVAARLRKLADRTPPLVDYPKGGRTGVAILAAGVAALKQATTPR